MRLASVALVLLLFAAAVVEAKESKSELAIRLAKEAKEAGGNDMSDKADNLKQKAENAKKMGDTAAQAEKLGDKVSSGKDDIKADIKKAEDEKHACDCEACRLGTAEFSLRAFQVFTVKCLAKKEELVKAITEAKRLLTLSKTQMGQAKEKHKTDALAEKGRCEGKMEQASSDYTAALKDLSIPTNKADRLQGEVDNKIVEILGLRVEATDLDFAKFQANQQALDVSNAGERSTSCISLTCFLL